MGHIAEKGRFFLGAAPRGIQCLLKQDSLLQLAAFFQIDLPEAEDYFLRVELRIVKGADIDPSVSLLKSALVVAAVICNALLYPLADTCQGKTALEFLIGSRFYQP